MDDGTQILIIVSLLLGRYREPDAPELTAEQARVVANNAVFLAKAILETKIVVPGSVTPP